MIEQVLGEVHCPACGQRAQVKERPLFSYVDLPVYGFPMRLTWKKHRMKCVNRDCPKRSWVLRDHRIAAKDCLLTTSGQVGDPPGRLRTEREGGGR